MSAIYKFAGDTTIASQILNNDRSEYRMEIEHLEERMRSFSLIYINGTEVERFKSIKFLGVTITDNLSQTPHDHRITLVHVDRVVKVFGMFTFIGQSIEYRPWDIMLQLYKTL
eukprot:g30235.t1